MAKTYTFAVSQTPAQTPIVTRTWTRRVEIQEDPSVGAYPSTDFLIYRPGTSDLPVRYLTGSSFVMETGVLSAAYPAGVTIGYISGVSGSSTFAQIEEGLN